MFNPRVGALVLMVLAAAATRLLPHPPNLTAMTALALFGGSYFSDRRLAFAVPMLALLLSDLALGVYWSWSSMAIQPQMWVQYLVFLLIVGMGLVLLKDRSFTRVGVVTLLASCVFFALTNLAEWAFQSWYPKTAAGLAASYVAAIPFFRNTVAGDVLYSALLFGGFRLLEHHYTVLRRQDVPVGVA
ncbi:MAG: DUF6580 family putative transport protein [Steroidobacteraceae bacterium]